MSRRRRSEPSTTIEKLPHKKDLSLRWNLGQDPNCWSNDDGVDDSSVTADDDEAKVLDKLLDEDRELSIGGVTFERVWYRIVPRFVTACLTRKGAEAFIARNGHNLTNPYIYVESLHRNAEMIALREHLMSDPCST